ncbi:tetratricopeptide repeat protein 38-like isoform X1 [Ostrea edulis]|uniref:tetratricopeptide repeat protein 38-like isoform X1 n=1 Tax=Ostrea edulis TaxID=37623 RepID=UPI0024AFB04C|nr:tetratricopeptide repeat protein 38-like isoform X1 [Ostrea edulis]
MRTNWRDCKAWNDNALSMSTPSNEACKLFDASLTQSCGMYDEPSVGGLYKSLQDMLAADPDFVMGNVLYNNMLLGGSEKPLHLNHELQEKLAQLNGLKEKVKSITEREERHIDATYLYAQGKRYEAIQAWEDILIDYPTDMMAVRQTFLGMISLGRQQENKDILTRVLPHYTVQTPGYSTVLGWQAFCLEENNYYDLAEKVAKKSLDLERHETYASHTLSHVYLMQGLHDKGLDFMLSTESDWNKCQYLACHNYWHVGIFYAEKGDFDSALEIFDSQVGVRTQQSKNDFNFTDAAHLLYRLRLEDVDVGSRWSMLDETSRMYMYGHGIMFNEAHLFLKSCRDGDRNITGKQLQSLKEYVKDSEVWDTKIIAKEVGIPLCEGILAFENGEYDRAVEILYPLRYDVIRIGGSHAQRDVFNHILIHATLKSSNAKHHRLGRMLLSERKVSKTCDNWTDRMIARFVAEHGP